jgi:hypothetical protein
MFLFYKDIYEQKWVQKGLDIALEKSHKEYFQASLQGYFTLTWCHEHAPQEPWRTSWLQKRKLSNQPPLMRVTPTVLLGSWRRQLMQDMASLGTDIETHVYWQGYIEEPAAYDFVAREARTIAFNRVQGTHRNRIKCEECLGNCPSAVIGQATINLYS